MRWLFNYRIEIIKDLAQPEKVLKVAIELAIKTMRYFEPALIP